MRNVYSKNKAFALAEVLVALTITTLAIILVAALSQQVINFRKQSKQVAGVVELRGKTAALIKDPDRWLGHMRATTPIGFPASLSACLPDARNPASSIHICPTTVMTATELTNAGLIDIANGVDATENGYFKAMETSIVDSRGTLIAGTSPTDPSTYSTSTVYLNDDGVPCNIPDGDKVTKCPFFSIGYFMRENVPASATDTSVFPGEVKFMVKVQMNPAYVQNSSLTPMKPQLMSMDLGTSWTKASSVGGGDSCKDPQFPLHTAPDGSLVCVDPHNQCPAGKVQVGYNSSGPLCGDPSTLSCDGGKNIILDPLTKSLVCAPNTQCQPGTIFTGYYSGSGKPICENPNKKCPNGEVQMGADNNSNPVCVAVPNCSTPGTTLSYNGTNFDCVSADRDIAGGSCSSGYIISGINPDGTPICSSSSSNNTFIGVSCPNGKYLTGIDNNMNAICSCPEGTNEEIAADGSISCASNFTGFRCASGTYLVGLDENKAPICEQMTAPPTTAIQTITKTVTLENPMCVASTCDRTYNLQSFFPEVTGKKILSLTISDYGYNKYLSQSCNTKVNSLTVSPTDTNKTHKFYTLVSTVTLNAANQTLQIRNSGTTKDGLGKACIQSATISIQYQ